MMLDRPSWDQYWMEQCYHVARRSRDLSTHAGCVIVGQDNAPKTQGYNSFPRGIDNEGPIMEDGLPRRQSRIDGHKYLWMVHAEQNAIDIAAAQGPPVGGCKLYINWVPCMRCAQDIIQAQISEVIIHRQGQQAFLMSRGEAGDTVWATDHDESWDALKESGRKVRWYDGPIDPGYMGYFTGKYYMFTGPNDTPIEVNVDLPEMPDLLESAVG